MRLSILGPLAAAAALCATGCDTTEPAYSWIGGKVDQKSFPSPVQQITIVSDRGVVDQAPVDTTTGAFQLSLVWGSTYVFLLSPDGQGTPLVVSTGSRGELEVEVEVVTGGLSADIGAVRFWGGLPSGTTAPPAGSCVGGTIQGTKQPCSSGPAGLVCDGVASGGDQGEGDGTSVPDQGDPGPDCMKGAPRRHRHHHHDDDDEGGDGVLTASPNAPMAIPALSLPSVLGCVDHLAD